MNPFVAFFIHVNYTRNCEFSTKLGGSNGVHKHRSFLSDGGGS